MKNVLALQQIKADDVRNYAEMAGSAASLGCDGEDELHRSS